MSKLLRIYAPDGVLKDELRSSLTLSNIKVFKIGHIYSPYFNTANIKTDYNNDLVGSYTFLQWVKIRNYGTPASFSGLLFDNSKFRVVIADDNNRIRFLRDATTSVYSANNALNQNEYMLIGITTTNEGVTNIYINGDLSGSADQDAGTPIAGSDIHIGSSGAANYFNGYIPDTILYSDIWTARQMKDYYVNNRKFYEN